MSQNAHNVKLATAMLSIFRLLPTAAAARNVRCYGWLRFPTASNTDSTVHRCLPRFPQPQAVKKSGITRKACININTAILSGVR